MRLKTDLAKVLYLAAEKRLDELDELEWDERPTLCVVMASEGYPGDYEKGKVITGLQAADEVEGVKVFHAGTVLQGDQVLNDGGRVLGVTAIGDDLTNAKLRAYQAVKQIRWEGAWCRKDISDKARNM
ncbi:MAG: phosphoribosylglycinamide synthetase C domain-containing protein [Planctomycetaceae bacterium]